MALWPRIDFAFLCCRFLSLLRIVGVHSNSIRHECITNLLMGPVEQSFRLAKAASKVHLAPYAIDKFLLEGCRETRAGIRPSGILQDYVLGSSFLTFVFILMFWIRKKASRSIMAAFVENRREAPKRYRMTVGSGPESWPVFPR